MVEDVRLKKNEQKEYQIPIVETTKIFRNLSRQLHQNILYEKLVGFNFHIFVGGTKLS